MDVTHVTTNEILMIITHRQSLKTLSKEKYSHKATCKVREQRESGANRRTLNNNEFTTAPTYLSTF